MSFFGDLARQIRDEHIVVGTVNLSSPPPPAPIIPRSTSPWLIAGVVVLAFLIIRRM